MSLDTFAQLALEHCGIVNDEVGDMLAFFHATGELLYYSTKPLLSQLVVLDPNWLLRAAACLVSTEWINDCCDKAEGDERKAWCELRDDGKISRSLLQKGSMMWKDIGSKKQLENLSRANHSGPLRSTTELSEPEQGAEVHRAAYSYHGRSYSV